MGDQAMESLGTEVRGGQDSDSKRGGSCFCYEGRKEMLLLRREAGAASATKGGRSCFCYEGRRELLLLRERMRRKLYY